GVHIADVSAFVTPGSVLDREARKRGTSVYLPQRVLPMLPELLSNGLASLQQGKLRYVKSVLMDFTPAGQLTGATFANGAIRVRRRFSYEEVTAILAAHPLEATEDGPPEPDSQPAPKKKRRKADNVEPEVLALLLRMRELGLILRKRRLRRGALELHMPEVE